MVTRVSRLGARLSAPKVIAGSGRAGRAFPVALLAIAGVGVALAAAPAVAVGAAPHGTGTPTPCTWTGSGTKVFDSSLDLYVTRYAKTASTTVTADCLRVKIPSNGVYLQTETDPLAAIVSPAADAASEFDIDSAYIDLNGAGTRNEKHASRLPSKFVGGGSYEGVKVVDGDTSADAVCPPPQPLVDAGLVGCAIAAATGSTSSAALLSEDLVIFSGQSRPQKPTIELSSRTALPGAALEIDGGSNWWGSFSGAPFTATSGDFAHDVAAPVVFVLPAGRTHVSSDLPVSSSVTVTGAGYSCTHKASKSEPPDPCELTAPAISGHFTVPANLSAGSYTVYVDESNTTPDPGNGPADSYSTTYGTSGTVQATATITVS